MGFLNNLWSGADFWDKEENKQQQTARTVSKPQNKPTPAQTKSKPVNTASIGRSKFKQNDQQLKYDIQNNPEVRQRVFDVAGGEFNNNDTNTDLQRLYKAADTQRVYDRFKSGQLSKQQFEAQQKAILDSTFNTLPTLEDVTSRKMGVAESALQGYGTSLMDLAPQRLIGSAAEFAGTQLGNKGIQNFGAGLNQPFRDYGQFVAQNTDTLGRTLGQVGGSVLTAGLAPTAKGATVGLQAAKTLAPSTRLATTAFRAGRYGLPAGADVGNAIAESGGSQNAQRLGSAGAGIVNAVTGTLGAERIVNPRNLVTTGLIRGLNRAGSAEAIETGAETLTDNFIAQKTYDPTRGIGDNLAQSVAIGYGGGVLGRGAVESGTALTGRYGGTDGKAQAKEDITKAAKAVNNEINKGQVEKNLDAKLTEIEDLDTRIARQTDKRESNRLKKVRADRVEEAKKLSKRVDRLTGGGLSVAGKNATDFAREERLGRVFEGVDGKPRFEVDDSGAKIKNPNGKTLGEMLDHTELFKNYPKLNNTKVTVQPLQNGSAQYDPDTNTIALHPSLLDTSFEYKPGVDYETQKAQAAQKPTATLLHEVQHAIQQAEGFSKGGDVASADYKNLAGEAEARAVASRMNMTEGERYKTPDKVYHGKSTGGGETGDRFGKGLYVTSDKNRASEYAKGGAVDEYSLSDSKLASLDDKIDSKIVDALKKEINDSIKRGDDSYKQAIRMSVGEKTFSKSDMDSARQFRDEKVAIANKLGLGKDSMPTTKKNSSGDLTITYIDDTLESLKNIDGNRLFRSLPSPTAQSLFESAGYDGVSYSGMGGDTESVIYRGNLNKPAKPQSTFYDSLDVPKQDLIIRDNNDVGGGKAMSTDPATQKLMEQAKGFKNAEDFYKFYTGSSTQYGDYTPSMRLGGTEGGVKITELGIDPDETVTIYRGIDDITGKVKKQINDGDFVTTDFDSAASYSGADNVVSMEVKAKDLILEDEADYFKEDPFFIGAEYVYTTKQDAPKPLNKSQLTDIYNQATQSNIAMSVDPKAPVESKTAKPSGKKTNLGFIETVKNSQNTAPEVNKKLRNRKRDTITNQDTLAQAKQAIKKQGFENAVTEARTATSATTEIQAKSLEVITQLQEQGRYDDAVEVVRSYAERAREAGQTVQIAAAYDRLTPEGILRSAQQQVERAKKKNPKRYKDLKITAEQSKKLTDMAKKVQAMPSGDAKILAQVKLQDEILKIVPTPASVKATTLWKAGLLTGIKGGVFGNTIGNSSMQLMKKVSDVPATAIDTVIGEWTGRRSKTFTLKGLFSGVGKGAKAGAKQFRQGTGLEDVSTKLDYDKTFYSDSTLGKIAQKYTDSVFGFYSASDKPFYFAALQNTLQDRASVEAKNKGLTGKAKSDFIAETVKNPPTEMNELAVSDALTAVFQNKNALSAALSGFKKGARDTSPAAGAVTEVVLPFTGVPSNIAAAVYAYSPVKPLVDIVTTVKSKGEFTQESQRQLVESVGKGITGTGIMWLGAQLVGAGIMTMGYPDDEEERALWEAEGKNEYSVKVGGKWRSLNYTGQLLSLLSIGGQYEKSKENGAGTAQAITSGALSGAKGVIEGSPLQGANNFLEAIVGTDANGDGSLGYKADKYIQGLTGSTVPTIVKDVANATDPFNRDINQSENALERYLLDPIKARTPGVSRTLPIKSDRFGNDKKRAQSSIESLIDPFRSSPAKSTSPTDELRRLYDGNKDTIFAPTRINGKNFGDENMSASKEEELKRVIGQNTQAAYDMAVKSDEYKRLDDDAKAKLIQDIRSEVYSSAKEQYKLKGEVTTVGNTPTKSANNTLSANDYPNLPQNETSQKLIADYEARVASGTYSEIDQVSKKRDLVKDVYKSDFDDATNNFYSIQSDANMRTAIEKNLVTREQLQKAADTDVILTQLGIQKYLQIGKTLRADYNLGGGSTSSTSSKTSSGSRKSSSRSSGSSSKSKNKFDYDLMGFGGSNSTSSISKSLRQLLKNAVVKA